MAKSISQDSGSSESSRSSEDKNNKKDSFKESEGASGKAAEEESSSPEASPDTAPKSFARTPLPSYLQHLKGSTRVSHETLGNPRPLWYSLIWGAACYLQGQGVQYIIQQRMERSFSLEDFLEGSKDALWATHQMLNERDWEQLEAAVTPRILKAMRGTAEEYASQGLRWRMELPETIQAHLVNVEFWNPVKAARFMGREEQLYPDDVEEERKEKAAKDAAEEKEAGNGGAREVEEEEPRPRTSQESQTPAPAAEAPGNPSDWRERREAEWRADAEQQRQRKRLPRGLMQVMTVEFAGDQKAVISREEGGQVLAEIKDVRPHRWKFARGPLPDSLQEDLTHLPWVLADI
ncbi:hypothetical protein H632_c1411p0 [Helicosporidium sp. ATCC 50920]|nr:hypothetical protein H632_c1411p0 [Helicosporidium sp. ATCC 50920]|eukprot:KDD74310.1 hypothetical protein H632_c1411p0 [Helicosporidium sp. ATCC 50920]